eukprot:19718-Chlamydomonas_euryale.AAC.4
MAASGSQWMLRLDANSRGNFMDLISYPRPRPQAGHEQCCPERSVPPLASFVLGGGGTVAFRTN